MRSTYPRLLTLSLMTAGLYAGCSADTLSQPPESSDGGKSGASGQGPQAGSAGAGVSGSAGQGGKAAGAGGGAGKSGSAGQGGAGAGGSGGSGGSAAGAGSGGKAGQGGSGGSTAGIGGATGGSGGSGQGAAGQGAAGQGAAGMAVDPVVGLKIEPANPVIEVIDGVIPPPIMFVAKEVKESGKETVVEGAWSLDTLDIASIGTASGALTASGLHGGKGMVTFSLGASSTFTSVTIKMKLTYDPQSQPPAIKDAFLNPQGGADGALSLLYPYDQTVFPRGLAGPELQWSGGNPDDVYRLHAFSDTFDFDGWFSAPPPSRFAMPEVPIDVWKKLTTSVTGNVQVDLQRWDGSQAYQAKTQTWRIAPANLAGTIYYTKLAAEGDVRRLSPGAKSSETFLQKNGRCVACHTVSSNGQRLVAAFDGGASPWGVFDAATGAQIYDSGQASGFQAMSPDGGYVLWRHWSDGGFGSEGALNLSTATDNSVLATLATGAGAPSHPSWSHDGTRIALANRTDGNGLDFTQSTLWLADISTSPPQFNNVVSIVDNTPDRPTVTFPSFTPDSQWIAFMRATQARTQSALGELWMTNGKGTTLSLDALNGSAYLPDTDGHRSFEPSFLPLAAGGYFWVVFSSTRAFGNYTQTGNRLQLWVAAIEQNPQPGQDPSHPAFRLPGQELDSINMRGQWARAVCKPLGSSCEAGYDCCDGYCLKNEQGEPVCASKPPGCVGVGNSCQGKADCCGDDISCINGFCSEGKN